MEGVSWGQQDEALTRKIEERALAEEQLRQLNLALIQARDAALEANQAKSRFLARMSHELRTPLNAIIGYAEMLEEDAVDEGDATAQKDLLKIQSSGKHLLRLIDDILDLSKVEAGKMTLHYEDISPAAFLRELIDSITPLFEKKHNRIEVDVTRAPAHLRADRTKLRQALLNLLSNANKFTDAGKIEVVVTPDPTNAFVCFVVTDTGIGIPPERLERIFDAFTQSDDSFTRKYGGTGLGLTISRRFCQMMGGELSAQSEVGQGSVFTICLPMTHEAA